MGRGCAGLSGRRLQSGKIRSIIVWNPGQSDCIYRSGVKGDIVNVGGDMATIMAGLACGEPNPLGWVILRNCATHHSARTALPH